MKLFDKLFNYELQAELSREQDCREAFPITSLEMEWLKGCFKEQSSSVFLQPETKAKLDNTLKSYRISDNQAVREKAFVTNPQILPNASFTLLRQAMRQKKGVHLFWVEKTQKPNKGWPMLLEFNMARREWYLVWFRLTDRRVCFTPFRRIQRVDLIEFQDITNLEAESSSVLAARRRTAVVEINPAYPLDRHRVLSALSAFDRDVELENETLYRLNVYYYLDEEEYLLQRIRFLGLRVQLKSPPHLVKRMRETVERVLATYLPEKLE